MNSIFILSNSSFYVSSTVLRHPHHTRRYVGRKRILIRFGALEREVIVKPGSELITVEIHPLLSLEQQVRIGAHFLLQCCLRLPCICVDFAVKFQHLLLSRHLLTVFRYLH